MKNTQKATHDHKRAGAVVFLESTTGLAKVSVAASGDEFWVKLTDLTPLVEGAVEEAKPSKKRSKKTPPNASANSHYRVGRAA
jgi:hypothetical protein